MAAQQGGNDDDDLANAAESGHNASVSPLAETAVTAGATQRHRTNVKVNRPVYTQLEFNEKYNFTSGDKSENISQQLRKVVHKHCLPSSSCVKKSLLSFLPFIGIMKQYSIRGDLFNDIISGLTVGIMHIPQG